ncbi:hypothetical protein L6164_015813 [Bauhinia variegata]|uniref:Uncharacterized protein n=1 Tax=Bauhinia variegata TaxID=167791 RepID=A0ACB9NNJ1_BAUVA|nr:hypothetical protein L6164_015813 [Bauhinia variegata]
MSSESQEASSVDDAASLSVEEDPLSANYGDVPLLELQSKTVANIGDWTKVEAITNSLANQLILIRGRVQAIRAV